MITKKNIALINYFMYTKNLKDFIGVNKTKATLDYKRNLFWFDEFLPYILSFVPHVIFRSYKINKEKRKEQLQLRT